MAPWTDYLCLNLSFPYLYTMPRTKIVAANWKMNLLIDDGIRLTRTILNGLPDPVDCEIILAPPMPFLKVISDLTVDTPVTTAAQNCHQELSGAYTGEVSSEMVRSAGATHCILGHSERREMFLETNQVIRAKVDAVIRAGLVPIFCCGESLAIRTSDGQNAFVENQMKEGLFHLAPEVLEHVVIAYEPIWAIGTGVTASPEQAQEMHAFIRETISSKYGNRVAEAVRILYGGSVKADNAASLFSQPDVDGGLIGGASLQPDGFLKIVDAACG